LGEAAEPSPPVDARLRGPPGPSHASSKAAPRDGTVTRMDKTILLNGIYNVVKLPDASDNNGIILFNRMRHLVIRIQRTTYIQIENKILVPE
jgi:hypothetical protein